MLSRVFRSCKRRDLFDGLFQRHKVGINEILRLRVRGLALREKILQFCEWILPHQQRARGGVPLQSNDREFGTHFEPDDPRALQQLDIFLIDDPAAAGRYDHSAEVLQLLRDLFFHSAERGFAALGKYLCDRHSLTTDDFFVHVKERAIDFVRCQPPDCAFAGSRETDEHNVWLGRISC